MPGRQDIRSFRLASFEQVLELIENFAPQEAAPKDGRKALYRRLRKLERPQNTEFYGDDASLFILREIAEELASLQIRQRDKYVQAEKKQAQATFWYWFKREKIEQQLEEIQQHDLVRSLQYTITFYEPSGVDCPHQRRRKLCERRYELLQRYREIESSPIARVRQKRKAEVAEELRKGKVDPDKARLEDFCAPTWQEPDSLTLFPVLPPQKAKGRPRKLLQEDLVKSIIGCLNDTGLTIKESCKLLARLLRDCLGETTSPIALEQAWYRLRPKKSKKIVSKL